ncbi:MAG TPA: hypothetical protein VJ904_04415, partial [Tichowtungia sp.]|nr:hypothetical protein [Tichowtungia sp.]
ARFGIPFEFLMMIFETGSFSTHRAVTLHSQHAFEEVIGDIVRQILQKVYRWRVAKAMNEGTLPKAPIGADGKSEWAKATWTVPYFEANDKNKQAQGDKAYVELGVETVENLIRQRNRNPEDVVAENKEWLNKCATAVEEHNKKHPNAPVSIDHFTNAATPGASNGAENKESTTEDTENTEEEDGQED